MTTTTVQRTDVRHVQRRTVLLLMLSETLGSVSLTVGFAVVGILAAQLAGSIGAVGFTQASQTVGAAIASYALAAWMNRQGRRRGLAVGYLIGALGAGSCMAAAATGSFLLLVAGAVALGSASASGSLSRYASTDLASPSRRATTLSLVVWTATAGAVAGPLLVPAAEGWARHLGLPPLAGPFGLAMVCTGAAAVLLFVFMRPDPLLLARAIERPPAPSSQPGSGSDHGSSDGAHHRRPRLRTHDDGGGDGDDADRDASRRCHAPGHRGRGLHALPGHVRLRAAVRPRWPIGAVSGPRWASAAWSWCSPSGCSPDSSARRRRAMPSACSPSAWAGRCATVAATSAHRGVLPDGDTRIQGIAETTMACVSAGAAAASGPLMAIWGFDALLALALLLTAGLFVSTAQIRLRPAPSQVIADQEVPTSTHGSERRDHDDRDSLRPRGTSAGGRDATAAAVRTGAGVP